MKPHLTPLLLATIATIAALGVGAGLLYASNQKTAVQNEKLTRRSATQPHEGFVPSSHAGVMVRHVPQKNSQAKTSDPSSILIKPGGKRPTRNGQFNSNSAPVIRRGQSYKGGTAASLPKSRLPLATAHKDKNGKVVVE